MSRWSTWSFRTGPVVALPRGTRFVWTNRVIGRWRRYDVDYCVDLWECTRLDLKTGEELVIAVTSYRPAELVSEADATRYF